MFTHSPASVRHAALLSFLDRGMGTSVDRRDLGFLFRKRVAERLSSRNVFCKKERADGIGSNHIERVADLVVEALNPRTADRDVGPNFAEEEQHVSSDDMSFSTLIETLPRSTRFIDEDFFIWGASMYRNGGTCHLYPSHRPC